MHSNNAEFHKLLAVAIAGLLAGCDDPDSDVRISADESLNRTITTLIDSHLGRLQVELYKTIKKEDTPIRSLRAALSKFSDLAHMVKPLKRRVFVTSLLPSLHRIMKMPGESIQETLASCMDKLTAALGTATSTSFWTISSRTYQLYTPFTLAVWCPLLSAPAYRVLIGACNPVLYPIHGPFTAHTGLFFTDTEVQDMLLMLVDNMRSSSVVIRRTATECAISICEGSSSPYHYLSQLVNSLFMLIGEAEAMGSTEAMLGALLGFRRAMISYQTELNAPFKKDIMDLPSVQQLFGSLMKALQHENHNIVTGSLEALQQLLKILKGDLLIWFRSSEMGRKCIEELGRMLLSEAKTRVSVRALALSCMTNAILHEPAGLRFMVDSCNRHVYEVIDAFINNSDPMLRGNVYQLIGNAITASLEQQAFRFKGVPLPVSTQKRDLTTEPAILQLNTLCEMLANSLLDQTASAARQACQGVRTCIPALLMSTDPGNGIELLDHTLTLWSTAYWLVKNEILDLIGSLDYTVLHHLELTQPDRRALLPGCVVKNPSHPFGSVLSAQTRCLEVVISLLGDEDARVRERATKTLVNLVTRLFYPEDWPQQTAITALAELFTIRLTEVQYAVLPGTAEPAIGRANLSRIVNLVLRRLHSTQSHPVLIGCYHALRTLSDSEMYANPEILSATLGIKSTPFFLPDVLPLTLDHLRVAWMSLELSTHVNMLGLVGNVMREAPEHQFRQYTPMLLGHVLRVLNICVHITTGTPPQPSKPSKSNSRPGSVSSPRRSGFGSFKSSPTPAPPTPEPADETGLFDAAESTRMVPPGSPRGYFSHLPHYVKLYETMKSAYKAGTITLDTEGITSKFGELVRSALEVLAIIVESEGLKFQGFAEEALGYLHGLIVPEPRAVLLCVQQLLLALFGKDTTKVNLVPPKPPRGSLFTATVESQGSGLYERCVVGPRKQAVQDALKQTGATGTSAEKLDPAAQVQRRKTGQALNKTATLGLIQLFEPLVIRAMNLYTSSSSAPLQTRILDLLCHLLALRVNYSLLDSDMLFVKSILKQLELIENGHARNVQDLLQHLFRFLTSLAQDQHRLGDVLNMPRLLQLTDGLLASVHLQTRNALPALQPIVQELFFDTGKRVKRAEKEAEAATLREVVMNTLVKQIRHPPVWEQLALLLELFKDKDGERWKRLSRKIIDVILPLLASGEITIKDSGVLASATVLFNQVAPMSLRPVVMLFNCLFSAAAPNVLLAAADAAPAADVEGGEEEVANTADETSLSWVATLIVVMECIVSSSNEVAILQGVSHFMLPSPAPDQAASPENSFMGFLLNVLVFYASHCRNQLVTDYQCQEIVRFVTVIMAMIRADSSPRLHAASASLDGAAVQVVSDFIRETNSTNPFVAIRWSEFLILARQDTEAWWTACGLGALSAKDFTMSQVMVRQSAFLIECNRICDDVGEDAMHPKAVTELCEKPPQWFALFLELSQETPVKRLLSLVCGTEQCDEFVEAMIEAVHLPVFASASAKVQLQVVQLLGMVPASTSLVRLLIVETAPAACQSVRYYCDRVAAKKVAILMDAGATKLVEESFALCTAATGRFPPHCPASAKMFEQHGLVVKSQGMSIEKLMSMSPVEWLQTFVTQRCDRGNARGRSETATRELLLRVSPDTIGTIINSPSFDLALLSLFFMRAKPDSAPTPEVNQDLMDETNSIYPESGNAPDADAEQALFDEGEKLLFAKLGECGDFKVLPGTRGSTSATKLIALDAGADAGPSDLSLPDRAHLAHALIVYLEVKPDGLRTAKLEAPLLQFCLTNLDILTDASFSVQTWELAALLDCCTVIICVPAISYIVNDPNAPTCVVGTIIDRVTDVFCAFSSFPLSVWLPSAEDGVTAKPQAPALGASLTKQQRHRLFVMAGQLANELHEFAPQKLENGITRPFSSTPMPALVAGRLRKLVLVLSRMQLQLLHSYGLVVNPDNGNVPDYADEMLAELASPAGPSMRREQLLDEPVLNGLVKRVRTLGYRTYGELDGLWEDAVTLIAPSEDLAQLQEEAGGADRTQALAVRAVTSLLMQSLQQPRPGDPNGTSLFLPRKNDISFLHTKTGQKMVLLRKILLHDFAKTCGANSNLDQSPLSAYFVNTERMCTSQKYGYGQISVADLNTRDPAIRPAQSNKELPVREHDTSFLHDHLQAISQVYGPIVNAPAAASTLVLCETVKSIALLTDVFGSEQQAWALRAALTVYAAIGPDDHMLLRHIVIAAAKSFVLFYADAPATQDRPETENLIAIFTEAIRCPHVSVQIATMHAWIYLLDAQASELILPTFSSMLETLLVPGTLPSAKAYSQFRITALSAAFLLIERYPTECEGAGFIGRIVDHAVQIGLGDDEGDAVYHCIIRGLDRLMLCFVALSQTDRNRIISLARLWATTDLATKSAAGARRASSALGLLVTCMYTSRDGDRTGGANPRGRAATAEVAIDNVSAATMEMVSDLFERIKVRGQIEAQVLERALPALMMDFLQPRQIMNVTMDMLSEFGSTENLSPLTLAGILHQTFLLLQRAGQQDALKEWVVLSCSK